jgi:hypothetical protein
MPQLEAMVFQYKTVEPLHSRASAASANSSFTAYKTQVTEHRETEKYPSQPPPIASAALIWRNTLHTLANCCLKQDKITLKAAGRTAPGFFSLMSAKTLPRALSPARRLE